MNIKRPLLRITILAAISLTLAGCGRNASENVPAAEKAPATPAPANPPPPAAPPAATNAAAATNAP